MQLKLNKHARENMQMFECDCTKKYITHNKLFNTMTGE